VSERSWHGYSSCIVGDTEGEGLGTVEGDPVGAGVGEPVGDAVGLREQTPHVIGQIWL
jgi:hypothetical protein